MEGRILETRARSLFHRGPPGAGDLPSRTSYAYSNPGMAALAYAVTASLNGAPQTDIRALLKARVLDPLGIPESKWSIGYGQAVTQSTA